MNIKEIIQSRNYGFLRSSLENYSIMEIVELINNFKAVEQATILRSLDTAKSGLVFSYLNSEQQKKIIKHLSQKEIISIIQHMHADDGADFLEQIPKIQMDNFLSGLDKKTRDNISKLLKFEYEDVGSIMTLEYISLDANMTVTEAFEAIRNVSSKSETVYTYYVLSAGKLIGVVSAKTLITAMPNTQISSLMSTNILTLKPNDNKEKAAKLFKSYGMLSLPVVDENNNMLGIITYDDGFYVLQEEATEDMQKMAGINQSDKEYFSTSVWEHARYRIAWLLIISVFSVLIGLIILRFKNIYNAMPLLMAFLPLVMNIGGTAGVQSNTMVICGINTHEIKLIDIIRILWTEFRVSCLIGFILSFLNSAIVFFWQGNLLLSAVLGASLFIIVIFSKLISALLPLLASKLNIDPTISTTPIINVIVDMSAVVIYFEIARVIFGF